MLNTENHLLLTIPLSRIGNSALVGGKGSTWVPQRNSIFLAFAFGWAEELECDRIYIGANIMDFEGYPDCRPEFFTAIGSALNLAGQRYIQIVATLIKMDKAAIIKEGTQLGIPWEFTWSCYRGKDIACGKCDACKKRLTGFREAGLEDPLEYE